jgi:predicted permease
MNIIWIIHLLSALVPRRLRADWRQEWEVELRYREAALEAWERLDREGRAQLVKTSAGAFWDALWLQPRRWEDEMIQDLRYGARMLLKNRVFTVVAVLTLGLGIGANTAVFSLIDALMLRSLPVASPEQLALFGRGESIGLTNAFPNRSWDLFSYPFFQDVNRRKDIFSGVAAIQSISSNLHGRIRGAGTGGEIEQMEAQLVSGNYFAVLGVGPALGRVLSDDDDQSAGGHPVAVLSHHWWRSRFGGDPAIIGKSIAVGETSFTIIGVAAREFYGTTVGASPDLWVPLAMDSLIPPNWTGRNEPLNQALNLIGRLQPGVSREQANIALNLLFKQTLRSIAGAQASPEREQAIAQARIELTPAGRGISRLRREFSAPLQILMAVVGVVLLVACANVANLLLARASVRQQEFALRAALGAGRGRILRQLFTESLLLATLGGAFGIFLAWWGSQVILRMVSSGPEALPLDVTPNARVLAFTLLSSAIAASLFGIVPAFRASRTNLNSTLKTGKSAASVSARNQMGKTLIAAQVALSLLLLVGAGLFIRTLINLERVDTGFQTEQAIVVETDMSVAGMPANAAMATLYRSVEEKIKAVPGVEAASFAMMTFSPGTWSTRAFTRSAVQLEGRERRIVNNVIGPDYFHAMGLPILLGRGFGPEDAEKSQRVAVVSESFVRRFFQNESPIGRRFGIGAPERADDIEIIGVVKDALYQDLRAEPSPAAFYPYTQSLGYWNNLIVRYQGTPGAVIPGVRRAIKEANPNLPVDRVTPLTEQVSRTLTDQKLIAHLAGFFGLLTLTLACIGLYGALSYSVARRTHEIGVRMALGARARDVRRLVMREALTPVLIGVAFGVPAALGAAQLASTLLFGLKATDPWTILGATLLLILVAALAGYLPARRASRTDPMIALRYD